MPKRPVVGDSGYGDAAEFRLGLTERGLPYTLQVDPTAIAHPGDATPVTPVFSGRGRPPKPRYPDKPATAAMRGHFLAIRVRPASRHIPRDSDGTLPDEWLIAERPPDEAEPVKYWLSTLPPTTPLKTLVRLAKIRPRQQIDRDHESELLSV